VNSDVRRWQNQDEQLIDSIIVGLVGTVKKMMVKEQKKLKESVMAGDLEPVGGALAYAEQQMEVNTTAV
jgi:hypothetical protein